MKYTVTIRTVYLQEVDIEAEDDIEAKKKAYDAFYPDSAYIYSMDVYGLEPSNGREDYEYEQQRQKEIDDEA